MRCVKHIGPCGEHGPIKTYKRPSVRPSVRPSNKYYTPKRDKCQHSGFGGGTLASLPTP
jgi:hypothetical protein